jgi:hypothetical protein
VSFSWVIDFFALGIPAADLLITQRLHHSPSSPSNLMTCANHLQVCWEKGSLNTPFSLFPEDFEMLPVTERPSSLH